MRYVADDGKVADKTPDRKSVAPPPLKPEVVKPLEAVVAQMWPGIKVVPFMDAGASDAVYTSAAGMPTYGITGLAVDFDDSAPMAATSASASPRSTRGTSSSTAT